MKNKFRRFIAYLLILVLMSSDIAVLAEEVIETLMLPAALQTIEEEAFYGNTSIGKVIVPDGTTEIRARAFADSSLTAIELPDTLTFIADDAFEGCGMISVIVPEDCYAYDWMVENGYINVSSDPNDLLLEFDVLEKNVCIKDESSDNYIDNFDIHFNEQYECTEELVKISGDAFDIYYENYWTMEGEDEFSAYSYRRYGFYAENVVSMGEVHYQFNVTCNHVTKTLDIFVTNEEAEDTEPENVSEDYFETEELEDGTVSIIDYTGDIKSIIIPDEIGGLPVSKIGVSAFESKDMVKVIIPEGVTTIDDYAFGWNWNLVSAPLPSSVKVIGEYAFNQCNLHEIELPEGLLSIGEGAFGGNSNIVSVHIPASMISIGGGVFYDCYGMESITLAGENIAYEIVDEVLLSKNGNTLLIWLPTKEETEYIVPDGVIEIEDNAFFWAEDLTKITLPESLEIIGDGAFCDCTLLKNVTIPSGCTTIGGNAFKNCALITEIVLPEGLQRINWAAFAGCSSLANVVLPQSVDWIDGVAFADNAAMTGINLPETIEYIEESAFANCPNVVATVVEDSYAHEWCVDNGIECTVVSATVPEPTPEEYFTTETLEDGTLSITSYVGEDTVVVIPAFIAETAVTDIARCAFEGCTEITYVVIPEGVTAIGEHAFDSCMSLSRISLPEGLLSIGDLAFQECDLKRIVIPDGVETLGWNIFNNNLLLKTVVIPTSVSRAGNSLISWNEEGTGITVSGDIEGYTFYHWTEIQEVIVQDGCTSIGEGAFMECTSLECVSLPESVVAMDSRVFADCENLVEVNIPDKVTELGDFVFSSCAFSEIKLPDSLESIGENAFQDCMNLTEIEIPYGVQSIGDRAFAVCDQLKRVTMPSTVVEIDGDIFEYGNQDVLIAAPQDSYAIEYAIAMGYAYEIIAESVPAATPSPAPTEEPYISSGTCGAEGDNLTWTLDNEGTLTIAGSGRMAEFMYPSYHPWHDHAESITDVVLEDGIVSISANAFEAYTNLISITIPDTVVEIGDYAFADCIRLTNADLPESVSSIGSYAFAWCESMTEIEIPDGVTTIGESAFHCCTVLTGINIPKGITAIENDVFSGCTSLIDVVIPENITVIGDGAFSDCCALNDITIPQSVTQIGVGVFQRCNSLTSVNILGEITQVSDHAFAECPNLTSMVIPDSVASIGQYAFLECSALENISIPDSVTIIGEFAFGSCTALTSIVLPEKIESVGVYAFSDCTSLSRITIPVNDWPGFAIDTLHPSTIIVCLKGSEVESWAIQQGHTVEYIEDTAEPTAAPTVEPTAEPTSTIEPTAKPTTTPMPEPVRIISAMPKYEWFVAGEDSEWEIEIMGGAEPYSVEYEVVYSDYWAGGSIEDPQNAIVGFSNAGDVLLRFIVWDANGSNSGYYEVEVCVEERIHMDYELKDDDTYIITSFHGADENMDVVIPAIIKGKAVTEIGEGAFYGFDNVHSVSIPDSVTHIDDEAFYWCTGLKTVVWPANLISIGDKAFACCEILEDAALPNGVQTIGEGAFLQCYDLEVVNWPQNLTSIGVDAFRACDSLTQAVLPEGIQNIGKYAFYGSGISAAIVPGTVVSLGNRVFGGCENLTDVQIGSGIENIPEGTFIACSSLSNITLPDGLLSIGADAFRSTAISSVELPTGVMELGENAFYGTDLISITLPGSLKKVSNYAFLRCKQLRNVEIQEGIESIGIQAFGECNELSEVSLPDTLATIDGLAFANCQCLFSLYIPEGVSEIDDDAFGILGDEINSYPDSFINSVKPCENLTLYVYAGSDAEQWAIDHDFSYEIYTGDNEEDSDELKASLTGHVTDTAGNPLSGVTVTVYNGSTTNAPFGSTTTDASGAWSMENVQVGSCYGVVFEMEGYVFAPTFITTTITEGINQMQNVSGYTTVRNDFMVSGGHINGLTAGYAGGMGMNIVVASTGSWTITSDSDWLTSSISGGENGDVFYAIIEANPDFDVRVGYFTLECEGYDPIIIRVTQSGQPRNACMQIDRPDETRITDDSAEITGRLIWGMDETAEDYEFVGVQYGKTGEEWQATIGVKPAYTDNCSFDSQTGRISAVITGLEREKVYRFRTVAQRTDGTWLISPEEVTAKIIAFCEHDYNMTYYAYDDSVKAYHDSYIAAGNSFLPETFVECSEPLVKHAIRQPYIQICSKCNSYNVIYQNLEEYHEWASTSIIEYENINENTHDAHHFLITACNHEINGTVCGYVFTKDLQVSAVGQEHNYENGVCACGYCNVVWKVNINDDKLHIDVSVESGQPDGNQNYLLVAVDDARIPYSAVVPKGTLSKAFAIKADLHLARAKHYKFYVVPEGVDLHSESIEKYFVSEGVIPLFAGNMVTGVYTGDDVAENCELFYGEDVEIRWDGSYGVDNTTVKAWVNSNLIFDQTFSSDGPDSIYLPYSDIEQYLSGKIMRSSEDKLTVNVTVNPPADSGLSPVTSDWQGKFVQKPDPGYHIYLSWDGLDEEKCTFEGDVNIGVDVTDKRFHITTAGGGSEYFGLRAYLDGEPLLLTETDCEYEWVFMSTNLKRIDDITTVYYPRFNNNNEVTENVWLIEYYNQGYTFRFNKDADSMLGTILLKKKGEDETLAYVTLLVHDKETFIVTGKDAYYSKNEAAYDAEISLPLSQQDFWESATKEQKRMLFDLNYKRAYINTLIPSSTVEVFIDACLEEKGWNIKNGTVQLMLNVGDVVTGTLGDIAEFIVDLGKLVVYDVALLATGGYNDIDTLDKTLEMSRNVVDSISSDNTIYKMVTDKSDFIDEIANSLNITIKAEAAKNSNTLSKTQAEMMYGFFDALFSEGAGTTKDFLYEAFSSIANKDFDSIHWQENIVVGFKYGADIEYVTMKPEELFDWNTLTNMTSVEAELFANMLLEKPSQDLLEKGEYRLLWKAMGDDWQKKAFDKLPKNSRMRKALRPDVLYAELNKYMDLADCLFAGYDAYRTMDLYDQALEQLEKNMRPLIDNYQSTHGVDMSEYDDEWVQELMDALTQRSASAVEEVLTAMVTKAVQQGLKQMSVQVAREIMADVAGTVVKKLAEEASANVIGIASKGASFACAAWTGVEIGLFLTNASGSVGKIPDFKELFAMYQSTQQNLYDAMDTYVREPSKTNYEIVEQLVYMYNILKGSCITTQYSIYINDAESLRARYANYNVWGYSVFGAFLEAVKSGNWDEFAKTVTTDTRKNKIYQYEEAMAGELEQMKDLIEVLLPKL